MFYYYSLLLAQKVPYCLSVEPRGFVSMVIKEATCMTCHHEGKYIIISYSSNIIAVCCTW